MLKKNVLIAGVWPWPMWHAALPYRGIAHSTGAEAPSISSTSMNGKQANEQISPSDL